MMDATLRLSGGAKVAVWSGARIVLAGVLVAPLLMAQNEALREAARLDAEGKCAESEPYYQRALEQGPPSPPLLNNLGNHYLTCGQPEKAKAYYQQLLETDPAHTNANLQLARLATEGKSGAEALGYLAKVKESTPAIDLLRAEASHWGGRRDAALAILAEVEARAASDPRVLFTLGLTCARMELYGRAEQAFSAVARHYPNNFDVLVNLGRAAARAGDLDRARGVLETALELQPGDVDTMLELGLVHRALGDPSRAVFVLAQARKKAPNHAGVLRVLAGAAEEAGYYGDSALALDEYLELRPGDDSARRDRGRVCARTETRREEGIEELTRYVEEHPEDARGHYDLAHLTWEETPEKALEELAMAVRLDPEFADAHLSRAWLLQRLGRDEEAVPHLETAIWLHPDSLRALDLLGLTLFALDRLDEAEQALARALAIAPDDPESLLHMGRTLMAQGRTEEAQEYLEKFQRVRPPQGREHGTEARMIELAGLSPEERRRREIERFREWSEERPDEAEFLLHLATLLLADGQTEEAVAKFQALLERNSNDKVRLEAGRSLLGIREYELAKKFLEQAVRESPAGRLDLAAAVLFTDGPERAIEVLGESPDAEQKGDYLLMRARILDAAGREEESDRVLREGLGYATTRPEITRQAALLLARHNQASDAVELLDRTIEAAPRTPNLLLTKAILLGLEGRNEEAEKLLIELESGWPEWDRAYLVHGLLLARDDRADEAQQKIRIAIALGSEGMVARCSLARLEGEAIPDPRCDCVKGLEELVFPSCPTR